MENKTLKYTEETALIIGCCMTIHTKLGRGFPEVFYQRALAIELEEMGIPFEREFEIAVFYKNKEIGRRRVDFLVDGIIVVELKATSEIEKSHVAQAINYLETQNIEVGLLINFGESRLKFKRIMNNSFKEKHWFEKF